MPWPVANVLCEGPSIEKIDPDALLLGPTVAVNHALSVPGVRVDFWATSDDPMNLWEWSEKHRTAGLRYFSTDQNAHIWYGVLGDRISRLLYSVHMTTMGRDENGMLIILPTVIPLLAWLLRIGCKRIRVFGADMCGQGSPLVSEWKQDPDRHWRSRWAVERVLFAHAVRTARGMGARIERWKPVPKKRAPSRALSA